VFEIGSKSSGESSRLAKGERLANVQSAPDGQGLYLLSVPGIRCGACVANIEKALRDCDGVASVRANLTLRRVRITLKGPETDPLPIVETLANLGYEAQPVDAVERDGSTDGTSGGGLLRATAVAGFGAMNVMLLSVAVWSGAEGATRETFHLISALIAVPVVTYAGQPFFRSAAAALRRGQLNMEVPIALAVLLALALSLYETARGGEQVFFDAAVTLLFFLLIGRYLDQLMREKARDAGAGLARLAPKGAMVQQADQSFRYLALDAVKEGMVVHIASGERVPVDVRICSGNTDIDRSLVTGEAMPVFAGPKDTLEAGTLNLTGGVDAVVLRNSAESFLAQMIKMLNDAECGRGAYIRIADQAAHLYAPVVHLLALMAFVGWMFATGGDWQKSIFVAISVLIITCPCALGLAVPVAHVVAAGRLMRNGILMKDGSAIERLAQIHHVVFDKTGTLTTSTAAAGPVTGDPAALPSAKALASHSLHPAARAIAECISGQLPCVQDPVEVPGFGVEGVIDGRRARLGRTDWVAAITSVDPEIAEPAFGFEDGPVLTFSLRETLRPGAHRTIAKLKAARIPITMLSGDNAERVDRMARELEIDDVRHGATPAEKVACLDALRREGRHTLMVGDGLNDSAALAAAHVSMAPASASDAGRMAADFVLVRDGLEAVSEAFEVACATAKIVRQNFLLAVAYNCLAIPLAIAGLVTPLLAALAMSLSSILVIGNSLRLNESTKTSPGQSALPIAPEVAA